MAPHLVAAHDPRASRARPSRRSSRRRSPSRAAWRGRGPGRSRPRRPRGCRVSSLGGGIVLGLGGRDARPLVEAEAPRRRPPGAWRRACAPSGAKTELHEYDEGVVERPAARLVARVAQLDARERRRRCAPDTCSTAWRSPAGSAAASVMILNVEPGGCGPETARPGEREHRRRRAGARPRRRPAGRRAPRRRRAAGRGGSSRGPSCPRALDLARRRGRRSAAPRPGGRPGARRSAARARCRGLSPPGARPAIAAAPGSRSSRRPSAASTSARVGRASSTRRVTASPARRPGRRRCGRQRRAPRRPVWTIGRTTTPRSVPNTRVRTATGTTKRPPRVFWTLPVAHARDRRRALRGAVLASKRFCE